MINGLVIHIGDPKTGTTSIQKALQARACTCDSITIEPQEELNASALANCLIPNKSPQKYEKEFQKKRRWAAKADADLGIISAEFFSGVDPQVLMKALHEFLPDYADSTRIISYVRPHSARALSGYAQRVKTGTYNDTLKKFVKFLMKRPLLNYHPRFQRWQDTFDDRFTLRPFVRDEMQAQDVTKDFFHHALGGAKFTLREQEKANESLSVEEISAMRMIQHVLIDRKVPKFLCLSLGAAIARDLAKIPERPQTKLRLDRVSAARLRSRFRDDARKLDDQYFGKPLMETELHRALESSVPEVQSLQAEDYFCTASIDEMGRIAGEIADLVLDKPHAWRQDYQLKKGQRLAGDIERFSRAKQGNATQVWSLLGAIAHTIASGSQEQDMAVKEEII